jgi:hypothetical protein
MLAAVEAVEVAEAGIHGLQVEAFTSHGKGESRW